MTVRIEPTQGPGRQISSTRMLAPWKYAAHGDWIYPAQTNPYNGTTVPSVRDSDLVGPLDAFDAQYSGTSLTVTMLSGEGFVEGAYVGSDDETIADSGGDVVHDVALDASTANQEVFLGYDHTQADVDALIIGKAGAFTAADQPRIKIWEFDTDAGGVTAARSHRPLGQRVDVPNTTYDSDRSGVVDGAEDAQALGGATPSSYLRRDTDDTMEGVLGLVASAGTSGTLGGGSGEVFRAGGLSSDTLLSIQGGHGRVALTWNAYYDGNDWRSIVANEPHAAIFLDGHDPGLGTSTGHVTLGAAPANANADDPVTFQIAVFNENGNLNLVNGQLLQARFEHRTNRPSSPSTGRIIYRADRD